MRACSTYFFITLDHILRILKEKMIVIPTLLGNLQGVKDLVKLLSQKYYFTAPFDSQHFVKKI